MVEWHGEENAMSWYMVTNGTFKCVIYGTGPHNEVPPLLFNLHADPDETANLAPQFPEVVADFEANLKLVIPDYASVSLDVATYGIDSFKAWQGSNPNWRSVLQNSSDLRFHASFKANPEGSFAAIESWLAGGPKVKACRRGLVWPLVADADVAPLHDSLAHQ